MMLTVLMNICPCCGQVLFDQDGCAQGNCPVCRTAWKMYPGNKIEVRLSL